jgi:GT2 family glycosyltransferase
MQLSIIIVNFNTPDLSLACIESIKNHSHLLDYEIIVVDNAPRENRKNDFENSYTGLKYIYSDINIGFGRANNLGMEIAKGDYLLLLNSDTLFINNSLKQCIDFLDLESTQHIGLIGCRLLNEDYSYQASFYPYYQSSIWNYFKSNNPILYKLFNVGKDFKETKKIKKVGDVSGAFMLLRRSVFEQVNGFDPDFFLYCEETDWCRNRIAKHFDIYYYPEAEIIHLGGKSAPKELMYFQSQLSLALFWYKKSYSSYIIYFAISIVNGVYYALSYPLSSEQSKKHIRQYLKGLIKTLPYIFNDIPKYKRAFGSRKQGLILEDARNIFFQ